MKPEHGSTVDGVLRRSARRVPARVAVDYRERSWTYAELDEAVSRAASVLLEQGLDPGDRVGAYGHNSDAYLIGFLACARAGLVHVPVNQNLTGDDLSYIVGQSGSSLVWPTRTSRVNCRTVYAPCHCVTRTTHCSRGWTRHPHTTVPSRGARPSCSCCTPRAPPPCPRAR